tara:strand:- start:2479 stop:2652 length:174 start_codon:yes stop_codon:yes gene_type:complete
MKEYFTCYIVAMVALSTACCSTSNQQEQKTNTPEIKIEECTDSCCNPPEGSDWWNDH